MKENSVISQGEVASCSMKININKPTILLLLGHLSYANDYHLVIGIYIYVLLQFRNRNDHCQVIDQIIIFEYCNHRYVQCSAGKKFRGATQRQGRYCSLSLTVTRCYILLFAYMTLLVNTCAYLYDRVESVRNIQSTAPNSSRGTFLEQCTVYFEATRPWRFRKRLG